MGVLEYIFLMRTIPEYVPTTVCLLFKELRPGLCAFGIGVLRLGLGSSRFRVVVLGSW